MDSNEFLFKSDSFKMSIFDVETRATAWNAEHQSHDTTVVRFTRDGKLLAIGSLDGDVYVRDSDTSRLLYKIRATKTVCPITSIKWHPKMLNTFICTSSEGTISAWFIENNQKVWSIKEEGNETSSVAISPMGNNFVTVGGDKVVRLYDLQSRQKISEFQTKLYKQGVVSGHEGRCFAALYHTENTCVTAGWDDTILYWDLRTGNVERTFFGPHLNGESLAIRGTTLITGSSRDSKQLQFWDITSGELQESISIGKNKDALFIYSLGLSSDNKYIGVGGGGMRTVQFYRMSDRTLASRSLPFNSPINALHFGKGRVACGLQDSSVFVDRFVLD